MTMDVFKCLILVLRILMCESFRDGRNFRRRRWKPRTEKVRRPDLVQLRSTVLVAINHNPSCYTRFASIHSRYMQVDDRSL
jgi:hypothetical protein